MRINKFVASVTGMSRRAADAAVQAGKVHINGKPAQTGQEVAGADTVTLNGQPLQALAEVQTIMLNKPAGFVVSREGQGSRTVYDLLPPELHHLKPVGRLDKNSSGLLLLTNDGTLAHRLTHPSYRKMKVYEIRLDRPLTPAGWQKITQDGVRLDDGPSKFELNRTPKKDDDHEWIATLYEGRNRQIRRTFRALSYEVVRLRRTHFGEYQLGRLRAGSYKLL